jgi:hypothetical protein
MPLLRGTHRVDPLLYYKAKEVPTAIQGVSITVNMRGKGVRCLRVTYTAPLPETFAAGGFYIVYFETVSSDVENIVVIHHNFRERE